MSHHGILLADRWKKKTHSSGARSAQANSSRSGQYATTDRAKHRSQRVSRPCSLRVMGPCSRTHNSVRSSNYARGSRFHVPCGWRLSFIAVLAAMKGARIVRHVQSELIYDLWAENRAALAWCLGKSENREIGRWAVARTSPEQNKALVLEAFDALFNKRDYAAAERYWSDRYIQHSAHIEPGRDGPVQPRPLAARHAAL